MALIRCLEICMDKRCFETLNHTERPRSGLCFQNRATFVDFLLMHSFLLGYVTSFFNIMLILINRLLYVYLPVVLSML